MLASKTVTELLEAFSSPTPTPGGGSAAALAGAVGASLLAMVAAMPKTKTGRPEERAALDGVLPKLQATRDRLRALIDEDAASYDAVVAAYRLPKGTDEEKATRKAAVAKAMQGATDVPLETMRQASSLFGLGRTIADNGNPNAKSDAVVGLQLAMAAMGGAFLNVHTNLEGISDQTYRERIRTEVETLQASGREMYEAIETLGYDKHPKI
jgi:formiminotetrahydrofolate cyclodeaminase